MKSLKFETINFDECGEFVEYKISKHGKVFCIVQKDDECLVLDLEKNIQFKAKGSVNYMDLSDAKYPIFHAYCHRDNSYLVWSDRIVPEPDTSIIEGFNADGSGQRYALYNDDGMKKLYSGKSIFSAGNFDCIHQKNGVLFFIERFNTMYSIRDDLGNYLVAKTTNYLSDIHYVGDELHFWQRYDNLPEEERGYYLCNLKNDKIIGPFAHVRKMYKFDENEYYIVQSIDGKSGVVVNGKLIGNMMFDQVRACCDNPDIGIMGDEFYFSAKLGDDWLVYDELGNSYGATFRFDKWHCGDDDVFTSFVLRGEEDEKSVYKLKDGSIHGKEFDGIGDHKFINDKFFYKARIGEKYFIVSHEGERFGTEFDSVIDIWMDYPGLAYRAKKGNSQFLVTPYGQFEGYDEIFYVGHFEGRIIMIYGKGEEYLVKIQGQEPFPLEFPIESGYEDDVYTRIRTNHKLGYFLIKGENEITKIYFDSKIQ